MRFLVDAQLPPALAGLLRDHGHEAEHVSEIGLGDASDSRIWENALENGAVIVTKDEDFPHRLSQSDQVDAPSLVWIRIGNTTRRALLLWFEPLLPQVVALIEGGEQLVEVR